MAETPKTPMWKLIADEQRVAADRHTTKLRQARLAHEAAQPPIVVPLPKKPRVAKAKT